MPAHPQISLWDSAAAITFASDLSSDFSGVAPISANDLADANNLLATFGGFVGTTSQTFNVTSPTSGFVPGATNERNLRQNDWAFYAGDAWRFRPNLTITYGLRYEYLSPLTEKNGLMLEPIPGIGQSVEQTLLSNATVGFVGGSSGRRPYNKDLHDFAPNIGIAWDPFGNGKTAVRAGYSVHYVNDDLATAVLNAFNGNAGLSSTAGDNNPVATVSGVNTLPAAALVAAPPLRNSNHLSELTSTSWRCDEQCRLCHFAQPYDSLRSGLEPFRSARNRIQNHRYRFLSGQPRNEFDPRSRHQPGNHQPERFVG